MADLLIKGGTVVLSDGSLEADVAVEDGKVSGLLRRGNGVSADRVIDAEGMLVMPGGIDPHVHFSLPFMGTVSSHDFYTGTVSAAYGGVTSVIDFAIQGDKPLMETVVERREEADGQAVIDYALHASPTDVTLDLAEQVKKVIEYGIPSFKVFMIYRKEGWMMDDGGLITMLEACQENGGLVGVHAENAAIAEYRTEKLVSEGKTGAPYHAVAKPPLVEAEAMQRALFLADKVGAALYVVHMSIGEGVDMVKEARGAGRPVYAETCTHYLSLTKDVYEKPHGFRWVISPPLRGQEHVDALWKGLAEGIVSTTGSDDAGFNTEAKDKLGDGSFVDTPNGTPGAELRLPVIWTEGVTKGRITPEQFVATTSTNAAKIFGLYPKKGTIEVGSDADIVIWDPDKEWTIGYDTLHMKSGWSPIEGLAAQGYPAMTISKGKVIVEDGEFKGKAGDGEFLKRDRIPEEVLKRPIA